MFYQDINVYLILVLNKYRPYAVWKFNARLPKSYNNAPKRTITKMFSSNIDEVIRNIVSEM